MSIVENKELMYIFLQTITPRLCSLGTKDKKIDKQGGTTRTPVFITLQNVLLRCELMNKTL